MNSYTQQYLALIGAELMEKSAGGKLDIASRFLKGMARAPGDLVHMGNGGAMLERGISAANRAGQYGNLAGHGAIGGAGLFGAVSLARNNNPKKQAPVVNPQPRPNFSTAGANFFRRAVGAPPIQNT
jgi:hypothetical protein